MSATKRTFCRICEAACGLEVATEGDRVVSIAPDPDHVVSKGYACIRGVRYTDLHNSKDRLKHPMKRSAEGWKQISWETALFEIAEKVRGLRQRFSPDAIGMYIGNPAAFSMTHAFAIYGFMRALGSRNVYSSGSQDCNNKFLVARRMYGAPAIQPVPDIARTACFVCIGSNPAVSHASFVHLPNPIKQLKAIEQRGTVWLINPRRTETAKSVGRQVFIRPGTDCFFLLALLGELIQRGAIDHAKIRDTTKGLDGVLQLVKDWPVERALSITGVPRETLNTIAANYLSATRAGNGAVLYGSTGLNQGGQGTLAFWLINVINCVTGNLDAPGGALVPQGLLDLPKLMKLAGLGMRLDRSRIGGFEAVMDTFPSGTLPQEITTPGEGQIKAMFVSAGNPILSCPDEAKMRAAFESLELLVCVDMFRNETGNLAHYMLPAASFLERPDLPLSCFGFSFEPYVQLTDAVVPPDGEQKDEWWIYTALCRALRVPMFGRRSLQLALGLGSLPIIGQKLKLDNRRVLELMLAASRKISPAKLRTMPSGVLEVIEETGSFSHRVLTADGRIDLSAGELAHSARGELATYFEAEQKDKDRLKLISKRERHSHNSWLHNIPKMVAGERKTNYLYMHPEDASAAGLKDGARACIRTANGSLELFVKLTEDLMPKTVAMPHGWGHQTADGLAVAKETEGVNVNRLFEAAPEALERYTGMTRLSGVTVEVSPA